MTKKKTTRILRIASLMVKTPAGYDAGTGRSGIGIPKLTDTPGFWENPPKNSDEALERVLDLPAGFEPGEDYAYSNTNYLLISELIKKVTDTSKFQYIKEEILIPLALKYTFGSIHDVDMDDLMSGYCVGIDEDIKTADYGSMVATAEDVGIFLRALNDGTVFDEGEQAIYSSIYVYYQFEWQHLDAIGDRLQSYCEDSAETG